MRWHNDVGGGTCCSVTFFGAAGTSLWKLRAHYSHESMAKTPSPMLSAVSCRVLPCPDVRAYQHAASHLFDDSNFCLKAVQRTATPRPAAVLIQLNLSILTWDHLSNTVATRTRTVIYWHHRNLLDPAWFIDHSKFSWSGALDTCYHWDRGLSSDLLEAGWDMWIPHDPTKSTMWKWSAHVSARLWGVGDCYRFSQLQRGQEFLSTCAGVAKAKNSLCLNIFGQVLVWADGQ